MAEARRPTGSPPQELSELAGYARRERDRFEALAAAHERRMAVLASTRPAVQTPAAAGGRVADAGSGAGDSLAKRVRQLQRAFDEARGVPIG